MDLLKKSLAPITADAWDEINEEATRVLKNKLSARKFVDVAGPKGWDYAAVPLGKLQISDQQKKDAVRHGIHQVQPLVETRRSFQLDLWELDNINRGNPAIELGDLTQAAAESAAFEEKAIYYGLSKANIKGLKESSAHKSLASPQNKEDFLNSVADGVNQFKLASIEGPYTLILHPEKWKEMISCSQGYPVTRHLDEILGGNILVSDNVNQNDMFLVTERGGDFVLTLGADFSLGYEHHDHQKVQLFLAESFTFQVLDPEAVIIFT